MLQLLTVFPLIVTAYSLIVTGVAAWLAWRLRHTERLLTHERMHWERWDESRRKHPSNRPQAD